MSQILDASSKERLGSERDGIIVAEKRQWSHAGTSLGTGGGLFFLTLKLLEAFFNMEGQF